MALALIVWRHVAPEEASLSRRSGSRRLDVACLLAVGLTSAALWLPG